MGSYVDAIRRIAIQKENYFTIFYQLNPKVRLDVVIADICSKWQLSKPEQYALQYFDRKIYITEENRVVIRDGDILTINFNVEIAASKYLSDIEQPDLGVKRKALEKLAGSDGGGQADDPLFAKEFINRNGINALVHIIEAAVEPGDIVAQAIATLQELLEHGFVSWDHTVNQKFVKKVLTYANKAEGADPKIVQKSLALLDNIVTVSSTLYITVMNEVNLDNIVRHLRGNDTKLQLSAISLCNSILTRMEHNNRKKFAHVLSDKGYIASTQKIVGSSHARPLSSEMNHQLYVYQALILSLLEPRMNSMPDVNDQRMLGDLNTIYNIAFESVPNIKDALAGKPDFQRLGFVHRGSPLMDFEECPPGVLAYDVMMYFATKHKDQYVKVILENFGRDKENECSFGKCTIQLTKMLCEVLNVGEPISDTSEDYQPMFFSTENIFEELYSVAIQLLNKTWKEMRATAQDFSRVIGVVKDQIKRVLKEKPDTIEKFKTKAFGLTYQQILRLMQQEAQERNILDSQTRPVMELREEITPEIRELVRQQRLAQLVEGQSFNQFNLKGKLKENKFWFCCLSPNHRFLHHGEVSNIDEPPAIDTLPNKVPLSEVTSLVTGKDCPYSKETKFKKGHLQLAFSLIYNQEEHLDFIAPTPQVFSVWTDALSSLLGKEMSSPEFQEDLNMLLNMEMKLILLDLEDVRIPDAPPPVPREPDNYYFYYKDD